MFFSYFSKKKKKKNIKKKYQCFLVEKKKKMKKKKKDEKKKKKKRVFSRATVIYEWKVNAHYKPGHLPPIRKFLHISSWQYSVSDSSTVKMVHLSYNEQSFFFIILFYAAFLSLQTNPFSLEQNMKTKHSTPHPHSLHKPKQKTTCLLSYLNST